MSVFFCVFLRHVERQLSVIYHGENGRLKVSVLKFL